MKNLTAEPLQTSDKVKVQKGFSRLSVKSSPGVATTRGKRGGGKLQRQGLFDEDKFCLFRVTGGCKAEK